MYFTTSIQTPIGPVRLACSQEGLTQILLPGSPKAPQKVKTPGREQQPKFLDTAARQIMEYFSGKRTAFDLPLAPQGTEFQLRVWEIIRSIPYGRTMSYGEIGHRLGSTAKARAVGGAAHANFLPLIIPCHRVIGRDGSLTGFASGLNIKERLLLLEKKVLQEMQDG